MSWWPWLSRAPHPDTASARLVDAIDRLRAEVECLCDHVQALTAATGAQTEQAALLRGREEQIFGQLDRLELWMATISTYPDTQERIPGIEQLRARIHADAPRRLHPQNGTEGI